MTQLDAAHALVTMMEAANRWDRNDPPGFIRRSHFRSLDGALRNAELVAEREVLRLKRARLRKEAKTAFQRAHHRCLEGNTRNSCNPQFINQIDVCEKHHLIAC